MSGHIDATIARIAQMTTKEQAQWQEKARRVLSRKPGDPDAERLMIAIADASAQIPAESWISTGLIAWEPGGNDRPTCHGFADGVQVARIFKNATHTASRKDVYALEVLGASLPDRFHHIGDARLAGEREFLAQRNEPIT